MRKIAWTNKDHIEKEGDLERLPPKMGCLETNLLKKGHFENGPLPRLTTSKKDPTENRSFQEWSSRKIIQKSFSKWL